MDRTIEIGSSHGTLIVDVTNGNVLKRHLEETKEDNYLEDIVQVDLNEFREYYHHLTPDEIPEYIDILDVGTWEEDGSYCTPNIDWRQEHREAFKHQIKENRGMIVGQCNKHPGNNFVNCPLCAIDKMESAGKEYIDNNPKEFFDQLADKDLLKEMKEFKEKFTPLDRHGNCPNCKKSWDGGDIYDYLYNLDINMSKTAQDIEKMASLYGWTPENKKKFSRVRVIEVTINNQYTDVYFECPDCHKAFNSTTSEQYDSLTQAINKRKSQD